MAARASARRRTRLEEMALGMRYFVEIGKREFEIDISTSAVTVDGEGVEADLRSVGKGLWHLILAGRSYTLRADPGPTRGDWDLELGGRPVRAVALSARRRAIREFTGARGGSDGPYEILAPMPGLVIKVVVQSGARVEAGQPLLVIEAMKMENELKALEAGKVIDIRATAGQTVDKGEPLVVIEPDGAA